MLSLTWLGHSTVVIDLDGVRLMTDPLLGRHAHPLRRHGRTPHPDHWDRADAVLLSHLHHDHAELRSLRRVGAVPVLSAEANVRWLHRKGIASATPVDESWQPVGDSGVEVRAVPAVHDSRPMPHRPNAANGHLVRGRDGTVVWAVGDTELYAAMRELPEWAGSPITVALMPIGGWGPRLSGGHLDSEEAAAACAFAGARWALPVHWGTLHPPGVRHLPRGWMQRPLPAFAAALERVAPDCRLITVEHGQRWDLPAAG